MTAIFRIAGKGSSHVIFKQEGERQSLSLLCYAQKKRAGKGPLFIYRDLLPVLNEKDRQYSDITKVRMASKSGRVMVE